MRLDELTQPQDRWEAETFLQTKGFNTLGSGASGSVYTHPKYDYVLKLFNKSDRGYRGFIDFCHQHHSEYLPVFKGKPMLIAGNYYAIRLEKLSEADLGLAHSITNVLFILTFPQDKLDLYQRELDKHAEQLEEVYPGLYQLIEDLAEYVKGKTYMIDVNPENIMMRGHTPVIIDPYFNFEDD